ncbi:MAG TPA: SurA N-terminal domain-containing protein, partial [Pseudogracilibacillus sp.]|nr:SurA N-terminal domain-containing protein [Pseudogracilibacillus sp.]
MKRYIVGSMLLLLAMILVACGSDNKENDTSQEAENALNQTVEITDEEKVADDEVVAIVNDDEVTGNVYNVVYSQLKFHSSQLGEEVDNEEIKEATMESIIDRQIVFQEAEAEGIDTSKEAAEEEFNLLKEENEENLTTLLQQFQITEEGFKEQLRFELMMDEFLTKTIDVSVSDDEVKEFYDEAKEENEEVPEFDDVKDQIKENMLNEKTSLALQEKVDEIKETAEI